MTTSNNQKQDDGGENSSGAANQNPSSFRVGNVSGTGNAVGINASAHVVQQTGVSGSELVQLFSAIYQRIDERPVDQNVDKDEIASQVKKIEDEVAKPDANPSKVERWLKTLVDMAPDIFDVTAQTLVNPAAGIAAVIRHVVDKMRKEQTAPGT